MSKSIRFAWAQAAVGFELSQWKTDYKNSEAAKDLHAQTSLILNS